MSACAGPEVAEDASGASLYASVAGIDGVYFYPPLGPEPTPHGTFDATLLDGISVSVEAVDAAGAVTLLATFDQNTRPAVALLGVEERYWVNVPAATYVTDPSQTYRIRVALDGNELGTSVLSPHVFTVLRYEPALPIGVHVRVEGSGAVRAIPRTRLHGTPAHCRDGVRNKDEAGVDCGGRDCIACPTCSDGIQNQDAVGIDCGGVCGNHLAINGAGSGPSGAFRAGDVITVSGASRLPITLTASNMALTQTSDTQWVVASTGCIAPGLPQTTHLTATDACPLEASRDGTIVQRGGWTFQSRHGPTPAGGYAYYYACYYVGCRTTNYTVGATQTRITWGGLGLYSAGNACNYHNGWFYRDMTLAGCNATCSFGETYWFDRVGLNCSTVYGAQGDYVVYTEDWAWTCP